MTNNNYRIIVFIPTYRCEKQIVRVIDQFDENVQKLIDTVMVIDNCSPDDTLQIAIKHGRKKITQCNFIAWTNDNNYGLGGSHKAAFRYAIDNGFDYLVVLHGDDQADIHDLIPLLEQKVHLKNDCLLGARFMRKSQLNGYSWLRTFGNYIYNLFFSLITMRAIYDLGSGLNLYRLAAFHEFYYKTFPDDLTFNYVMLLASYYRKQEVSFFPISWREEDQISNVKLFDQAFKVLWLLIKYSILRGIFLKCELRGKVFDAYTGQVKIHQDSVV